MCKSRMAKATAYEPVTMGSQPNSLRYTVPYINRICYGIDFIEQLWKSNKLNKVMYLKLLEQVLSHDEHSVSLCIKFSFQHLHMYT